MVPDSASEPTPPSFPRRGIVRERLEKAKREAVEMALGKEESWCTKLLNNGSGVRLDDIPLLLDALGLKAVSKEKQCVHPELARAYDAIVRKATQERNLLFEDAE